MVVMMIVGVCGMDMPVFNARREVFQKLLKEKTYQHKQTNEFQSQVLTVKFW
jgi:hypothetical protein